MRSLSFKLTLAFLIVSLAGVGLVAVLIWQFTSNAFNRFLLDRGQVDYVNAVTAYYQTYGSWSGVDTAQLQTNVGPQQEQQGNGHQPPPPFALADQSGTVIVSGGQFHSGDSVSSATLKRGVAITVNGQVVGTVLATGNPPSRNPTEQNYIVRTNEALVVAALGSGAIALVLGIFLARSITRPVRELTTAAHAMAKGQLKQQVPVRSQDELGELTMTFNYMSADLEHSNQLRRQMTADIAHDLRTPLTVITGYLESLRDGVLKPTPERFEVLYSEARHLQRLVEDLRTLSLADAGELSLNRQPVPPLALIEQAVATFRYQADKCKVHLSASCEPGVPDIVVDPERIEQVLGNLISNALRYTSEGGEIKLAAAKQAQGVALIIQDNGDGIEPEVLPHVFDRFYRGDEARQDGGSGLGLAIAKAMVELHGGKITALSAGKGQGSTFTIFIPTPLP